MKLREPEIAGSFRIAYLPSYLEAAGSGRSGRRCEVRGANDSHRERQEEHTGKGEERGNDVAGLRQKPANQMADRNVH